MRQALRQVVGQVVRRVMGLHAVRLPVYLTTSTCNMYVGSNKAFGEGGVVKCIALAGGT